MTTSYTEDKKTIPCTYENCPCTNECPRHGHCVECISHHLKTPPPNVVVCMQEKAKQVYGDKK